VDKQSLPSARRLDNCLRIILNMLLQRRWNNIDTAAPKAKFSNRNTLANGSKQSIFPLEQEETEPAE
jgi:hypothetical protein